MSQAHEMTVPVLLGHYVNQSNQATLWQKRAEEAAEKAKELDVELKAVRAELNELKPKAEDSVPDEGPTA